LEAISAKSAKKNIINYQDDVVTPLGWQYDNEAVACELPLENVPEDEGSVNPEVNVLLLVEKVVC
jgi:hypothetical protein